LTQVTGTSAYTALSSGGCGVTVAYLGTYIIWLYIWGPDNGIWTINANSVAITGATFSNSFPAGGDSPATGFAIVNLPSNGQEITITGSNLAEPQGGISVNFAILRIR
jgi:hypothetical protein